MSRLGDCVRGSGHASGNRYRDGSAHNVANPIMQRSSAYGSQTDRGTNRTTRWQAEPLTRNRRPGGMTM